MTPVIPIIVGRGIAAMEIRRTAIRAIVQIAADEAHVMFVSFFHFYLRIV